MILHRFFYLFFCCILPMQVNGQTMIPTSNENIRLHVGVANPILTANQTQKVYLKTALIGADLPVNSDRSPINVALVLDKSGSMRGQRIQAAKEAAIMTINSLQAQDIISVISYDTNVNVIVPATKMAHKRTVIKKIKRLQADGSTALYAGVEQGAIEVEKFMDDNHINRVILLSDGKANVGKKSVTELAQLGEMLGGKGISVTTIGLGSGYNEDLMSQLASYSDGNHAFVQNASDLERIFRYEFGDVTSVIAKNIQINIHCAADIRPVQVMGREAVIQGQNINLRLNQLPAGQEKFVIVELEVPASAADSQRELVKVSVDYLDLQQQKNVQLTANQKISFSASQKIVEEAVDEEVMADSVAQVANQMSKQAVQLRDEGKVEESKGVLERAASYLRGFASTYESEELEQQAAEVQDDADKMGEADWNVQRKSLREKQYKQDKQQTY